MEQVKFPVEFHMG